ncbi:hypothetical protein EELLY_v1c02560 [Entomoplasma ellychniae]|uniref:HTH merR-type domain-containing protein n=1 Tax=Entomoplasma ellychniae TaxID=2114 RepID=A0A8E2UAJ2_9MOLU|nr:MerR family transcriptional regulator [Entomoplasma ellychniae]PPE04576.1 hypothetical protein EELLY_v1c02560 [Entomoplasma ellychniae]
MQKIYMKQIADKFGIEEHTLRFYDKKGLFPFFKRDENNYRFIYEDKINWIEIVLCLKKSGMSLIKIKEYINLAMEGENTYPKRLKMMLDQEQIVLAKIQELKQQLKFIEYKKSLYKNKK